MIKKIHYTTIKNIKRLLYSKSSVFAIIIAPLVMVILLGVAFSSTTFENLSVGIYSLDNQTPQELIYILEDEEFNINHYSNQDECLNNVKIGVDAACLSLEMKNRVLEVIVYVDYSRISLSSSVLNEINTNINTIASERSYDFAVDLVYDLEKDVESLYDNLNSFNQLKNDTNKLLSFYKEDVQDARIIISNENINANVSFKELIEDFENSINDINTQALLDSSALSQIDNIDVDLLVAPIESDFKQVDSIRRSHLDYIFPGLLVVVVMFVGIIMGSLIVMKEKLSKANFRNSLMSVNSSIFFISTYVTANIFIFLQILVFLFVAVLIFKASIALTFTFFLYLLLASFSFVSIGILISNFSKNEEVAVLTSIGLSILMLMFSNLITPIETLKTYIYSIVQYLPVNVFESLLRPLMIYGIDLGLSLSHISYAMYIVTFILTFLAYLTYGR